MEHVVTKMDRVNIVSPVGKVTTAPKVNTKKYRVFCFAFQLSRIISLDANGVLSNVKEVYTQ